MEPLPHHPDAFHGIGRKRGEVDIDERALRHWRADQPRQHLRAQSLRRSKTLPCFAECLAEGDGRNPR